MKVIKSFTVADLTALETPLANKFYRKHGFRGKARRGEVCAVVRDERQDVIACGYLRDYQTFKLLAGVAVAPAYQGQGVARLLLQHLTAYFDQHTHTFPYEHLQPFYLSLGFELILPEPQTTVAALYDNYRKQGRAIVVMQYMAR
jgi:GNAT superfamily N-acetyltransferase